MYVFRVSADRPYITCRELLDFLYLYLENELPLDRRREFERHLGVCAPCRDYIRRYEESIRLGKAAFADPELQADDCAPEDLVRAILASRTRS
jgi:anti-sigma factor RsiW